MGRNTEKYTDTKQTNLLLELKELLYKTEESERLFFVQQKKETGILNLSEDGFLSDSDYEGYVADHLELKENVRKKNKKSKAFGLSHKSFLLIHYGGKDYFSKNTDPQNISTVTGNIFGLKTSLADHLFGTEDKETDENTNNRIIKKVAVIEKIYERNYDVINKYCIDTSRLFHVLEDYTNSHDFPMEYKRVHISLLKNYKTNGDLHYLSAAFINLLIYIAYENHIAKSGDVWTEELLFVPNLTKYETVNLQYQVHNSIKPTAKHYIPRPTIVKGISEALKKTDADEKKIVFLSALGGFGKTEVVREYASKNPDHFKGIYWLSYPSTIYETGNVGISLKQLLDTSMHYIPLISEWDENTLIIVDGFNECWKNKKFMHELETGTNAARILITTTDSESMLYQLPGNVLQLEFMEKETEKKEISREIFIKYYGHKTKNEEKFIDKINALLVYNIELIMICACSLCASQDANRHTKRTIEDFCSRLKEALDVKKNAGVMQQEDIGKRNNALFPKHKFYITKNEEETPIEPLDIFEKLMLGDILHIDFSEKKKPDAE